MVISQVVKCGNPKCNASVDINLLNKVKLKAVRRTQVMCKKCKKRTKWSETQEIVDDKN